MIGDNIEYFNETLHFPFKITLVISPFSSRIVFNVEPLKGPSMIEFKIVYDPKIL